MYFEDIVNIVGFFFLFHSRPFSFLNFQYRKSMDRRTFMPTTLFRLEFLLDSGRYEIQRLFTLAIDNGVYSSPLLSEYL